MRRVTIVVLVVLIGIALFVGLHPLSPTRTADDYEHKAKDTAESVLSSVQTARVVARVGTDGDAFGPYVSVVLSESETGATQAQGVFDGIQPPDARSDAVRDRLGHLLDRSVDTLSQLRIAARRGELDQLAREARPLRALAADLQDFIDDPGAP